MSTYNKIYGVVSAIIFLFFLTFVVILPIRNSICRGNFGSELNQRRKSLHIPVLPTSWYLDHKEETFAVWRPKGNKVKGHGYKEVVYESCELDEEDDHYYFDLKVPSDTTLEINYKYVNSKRRKDSTIFIFQIGTHADTISKKMADSILRVHKTSLD